MNKTTLTAGALIAMLRARFGPAGYTFLAEVSNATGSAACRRADGLAVSLWPSRGLYFLGFEIKVSRQDWARELARPNKADVIGKYCHFWYLVVSDPAIVYDGELPEGWGLLAAQGDKLATIIEAPRLNPMPPSMSFVAAILRRFADSMVPAATVPQLVEAERERLLAAGAGRCERDLIRAQAERKRLAEQIRRFEEDSGIQLDSYTAGNVALAMRILSDAQSFGLALDFIQRAQGMAKDQLRRLDEAADQLADAANKLHFVPEAARV